MLYILIVLIMVIIPIVMVVHHRNKRVDLSFIDDYVADMVYSTNPLSITSTMREQYMVDKHKDHPSA